MGPRVLVVEDGEELNRGENETDIDIRKQSTEQTKQ